MNKKEEYLNNFRTNLQQYLTEHHITQSLLAEESGVNQGTVSNILNGRRQPTLWLAYQLCEGAGTKLSTMTKIN